MKKNTFNDKLLIRILIFGLLAIAAIALISHYIDKTNGKETRYSATKTYIQDNNINGQTEEDMLSATKDATEEESVAYRTTMLTETGSLLDQLNRMLNTHFNLLKKQDKEFVADSIKQLENTKQEIMIAMNNLGAVYPPNGQETYHNTYLESMSLAAQEIDAYIDDIKNGKIVGASSNTHIDKIKNIISKIQSLK